MIYPGSHRSSTSSSAINSFCCGANSINSIVFDITYCNTISRNHGWLRSALFADFNYIEHRSSECHCLCYYNRNVVFSSRLGTYRYGREDIPVYLLNECLAGKFTWLSVIEIYINSIEWLFYYHY